MTDFAILLLSAAVVGGGVLGALLRGWSVVSRLIALEGAVLRLQKQNAAAERWNVRDVRQALEKELATAAGAPAARGSAQKFLKGKFGGGYGI